MHSQSTEVATKLKKNRIHIAHYYHIDDLCFIQMHSFFLYASYSSWSHGTTCLQYSQAAHFGPVCSLTAVLVGADRWTLQACIYYIKCMQIEASN